MSISSLKYFILMTTDLKIYYLNPCDERSSAFNILGPFLHKCTQTLFPIRKDSLVIRNIYGNCISVHPQTSRYGSIISGQGICAPSAEVLWPGARFMVHCIQPVYTSYIDASSVKLLRPCVEHSAFLIDQQQECPLPLVVVEQTVLIPETHKGFVSYCPILCMTLINFDVKFTENQEEPMFWTLTLEENQ